MRHVALIAVIALLSCSDPLGPLTDGKPYALRAVNGEPLPWAPSTDRPIDRIADGWVRIIDESRAERHERIDAIDGAGTVIPISEWNFSGPYRRRLGMLIITYEDWHLAQQFNTPGPSHPVDTFYVSDKGLVLREIGSGSSIAPGDTLVRYYAP